MKNDLIKKLLQRFAESKTVLRQDKVEHSYAKNREALVDLLSDHPDFMSKVLTLRAEYRLPADGYTDPQQALHWELSNKESERKLFAEIDSFVTAFSFNKVYLSDVKQFTYEMIVCPLRSRNWSKGNIPSLVILNTDEDKQVNAHLISPNSRYVQIFDWTTLKDIERSWKDIQKSQNQRLSENIGNELRKKIWHLRKDGLNYREIHQLLISEYKHLFDDATEGIYDESRIGIYAKRYEDSLKRLKEF